MTDISDTAVGDRLAYGFMIYRDVFHKSSILSPHQCPQGINL
jgi:hypothetical protein